MLSPYIRHNLLTLAEVYLSVKGAPYTDREKFRDELYWQEYARHLYARIGTRIFDNLRFEANSQAPGEGWNRELACIDEVVSELESDGWLVNQTRMWLAPHWTVRNGIGWTAGQERMFHELIDGSRAANLLGWQWTVGSGTGILHAIDFDTLAEAEHVYSMLSINSTESSGPLAAMPWGAMWGSCLDQYGVRWVISHTFS